MVDTTSLSGTATTDSRDENDNDIENVNDNNTAAFSIDVSSGDHSVSKQSKRSTNNSSNSNHNETLHLRWTNLTKSVDTKDDTVGATTTTTTNNAPNRKLGSKTGTIHPTGKKVILDNVSGEARPGELLATMGPSGSGKTSLMNVLCGRAAYQGGSITINGETLDKAGMKKLMSKVAYVKQQDVFFETLTVRDQLTYTARLRFPDSGVTKEDRNSSIRTEVDRILDLLRLGRCADSPIRMCSGGEKKRVNIGTELLTDPSIILLDEPTSGLDSASAMSLLGVLRDLAHTHGKTIVTTIHQPNSATFLNTFDKLLMLSDGKTVYFGTPSESLAYLKTVGLPCPEGYNAADHWMDLLVPDVAASAAAVAAASDDDTGNRKSRNASQMARRDPKSYLQMIWDNDAVASRVREAAEIQRDLLATDNGHREDDGPIPSAAAAAAAAAADGSSNNKYSTTWMTQYKTLTHRAFKKNTMTVVSPINISKTLSTGVAVGIVYFNKRYTEVDVFNIYAYFFFVMLFWVMDGLFASLFAFPAERVVILKERATASYRLSAYYLAATTADLPVFLFTPFVFLVVSYWMAVPTLGIATFVAILLIALLAVVTGQGLGQLVGAAFDDIQVGQAVATVVIVFLMLLGGFFTTNLPGWLSWVRYLSPFAYASNAALGVIFNEPIPCDGSGALGALCDGDGGDGDGAIFADPDLVKESFAVYGTVPSNIVCLLAACVVPRLGAYYFLRKKKAGERE